MDKRGPIIVIEDDEDDRDILRRVFQALNTQNEVIYFNDGEIAYEYLVASKDQPFLIISDINMPKLNGIELREKVQNNEQLKLKCIPYLFFTTAADQQNVIDAYSKSVQGFFTKPNSYEELERVIGNIVDYWKDCHAPNVV